MNAQLPIERRKFIKWVRRYCKDNAEIFESAAISLSKVLEQYGYDWIERSHDGFPAQINSIEFNKIVSGKLFSDIMIFFNTRRGRLIFSAGFANRALFDEYRPTVMGDFVSRQSELESASLWGPRWYHFDKKRKFQEDWKKLEETIPHIVKFLEDGTPHPNIYGGPVGQSLPTTIQGEQY